MGSWPTAIKNTLIPYRLVGMDVLWPWNTSIYQKQNCSLQL